MSEGGSLASPGSPESQRGARQADLREPCRTAGTTRTCMTVPAKRNKEVTNRSQASRTCFLVFIKCFKLPVDVFFLAVFSFRRSLFPSNLFKDIFFFLPVNFFHFAQASSLGMLSSSTPHWHLNWFQFKKFVVRNIVCSFIPLSRLK